MDNGDDGTLNIVEMVNIMLYIFYHNKMSS